jgi:hypothetical protein
VTSKSAHVPGCLLVKKQKLRGVLVKIEAGRRAVICKMFGPGCIHILATRLTSKGPYSSFQVSMGHCGNVHLNLVGVSVYFGKSRGTLF